MKKLLMSMKTVPTRKSGLARLSFSSAAALALAGSPAAADNYEMVSVAEFNEPNAETERIEVDGIPFLIGKTSGPLDLSQAKWPEWEIDPASFTENYDRGVEPYSDLERPMVRIPADDYSAVWLLAVAGDGPDRVPEMTFRIGRFGETGSAKSSGQVLAFDFPAKIPVNGAEGETIEVDGDPFFLVRVPLTEAVRPHIEDDFFDVELTKQVRLARRQPDPNRYRFRPLGLPSGVKIAGLTFEKSPLVLEVSARDNLQVFEEPDPPAFDLEIRNRSDQSREFLLRARATASASDGSVLEETLTGTVEAGAVFSDLLQMEPGRRGYFDLEIELEAGEDVLQTYTTSLAVVPPNRREYRHVSPFGTWDFGSQHFSSDDIERIGRLHELLGLRFGLWTHPYEVRKEWGVIRGIEPKITRRNESGEEIVEIIERTKERHPDMLPLVMLFHEDAISGDHVTRVPDIFHDREPYQLNERERERFQQMRELAEGAARAVREHYPDMDISIGNGNPMLTEEFYRHNFPAELFDSAGNEAGSFMRPPESQPPDWVANNASIWIDRQLLDHYGYGEKDVVQCYEITIPCTNPGNLHPQTQADYFARHALHSLAWEIPRIRPGLSHDVGNSYRFSNWGSAGFMRSRPGLNPKPAFVSMATLTRILEGSKFVASHPTGSQSAYLLEFERPDGKQVLAAWTVRGTRPMTLRFEGEAEMVQIDWEGNETGLGATAEVEIELSPSPSYLVVDGGGVATVSVGTPEHEALPAAAVSVEPFESLEAWEVVEASNPLLEYHNPITPRRHGDFDFSMATEVEGRAAAVKVVPNPIDHGKPTMPMYVELRHKQGIELPGEPTELGLRVNGNSGWGRLIFELVDASGQAWTSIGASGGGELSPWMLDWMPEEVLENFEAQGRADWNTDDVFGLSRINFDGWRYVGIPLPGNYAGEGYGRPANSQWRHDGDGIVHYPLTLTKVIVELNENVLHVREFDPVHRPEIYFTDLTVSEGEKNYLKDWPGEWAPPGRRAEFNHLAR